MSQLTDVLTAISHPTRRAIIGQLANGPARFLDVAKPHGTALNAVTKHLKMLERAGLIERERRGREVLISFRGEPLREVAGWVHEYERFWNQRLDEFARHFRDKKEEGEEVMKSSKANLEFRFERTIPAPPGEVFDGWLNPRIPGNPWNKADKLLLNPEVDGFFYWALKGTPHYGRFTEMKRPVRMQHTWVSPNTLGEESTVTVTFEKQGKDTRMTLVHSGIPDTDAGRGHEKGWNYFLDIFPGQFGDGLRKEK